MSIDCRPPGAEPVADNWATRGKRPVWTISCLQFSWPNYYPGIESLALSGGDDTGMWMPNYPFPYSRAETSSAFRLLADRLVVAINARGTDSFDEAILLYWQAREAARDTVAAED